MAAMGRLHTLTEAASRALRWRGVPFGLAALSLTFGAATAFTRSGECEWRPLPEISDEFHPELSSINSVDEAVRYVRVMLGAGPHSERQIAEAAATLVRKRFFHGFAEFRPCDDWLAYLAGYVWDDLRQPVVPDHVLMFRRGACNQQSMVFQAIVARFGLDYASVGFPAMQGPDSGHFAAAVRIGGEWQLFDADKEIPVDAVVPVTEVLAGGEILEELYPDHGRGWREAGRRGWIWFRGINENPAPQAALLHRTTEFMSTYGWAVFAALFLILEAFRWRVSPPARPTTPESDQPFEA